MLRLIAIVSAIFLTNIIAAQDTLKKVSINVGAEFWTTFVAHPYYPKTNRPAYLDANSFNRVDTLKDSPVKHGAYYAAIKTTTSFTPGLQLSINIYGEHRGISYGIYSRENIIVYPIFLLKAKDSVQFLKRNFIIEGRVGDLLDKKLDEGLFIYNIDVQGGEGTVATGKWKATLGWYGDFIRGVGLNIDDVFSLSLNRGFGKQNNTVAGAAVYAFAPPFAPVLNYLYYSMYFRHHFTNGSVYVQAGFANNKGRFYSKGLAEQAAFVAGGNLMYRKNKWSGATTGEVRYYGSSVNLRHSDNRVRYRDPNADLYANTTGEYLYPLRKYDNSFSQWAVFTEYIGCDVWSTSLSGNISYAVSKKTSATIEYDLNYIAAVGNKAYNSAGVSLQTLYPFYNAGYYYTPLSNCRVGIIITNRGMNLNLGYPTLHQFTRPYIGFKIRCAI